MDANDLIWVYPGHSEMMLDVDVVDTQVLSILIHLSCSKMTQPVRPTAVVGTHSYV